MTVSTIIFACVLQAMKEGTVNKVGSIFILCDDMFFILHYKFRYIVIPKTIMKGLELNFGAFYVFSQTYNQVYPFYL